MKNIYAPRLGLRPRDLRGISEEQIAQHWALYEGYVANVNLLNDKIKILSANGYFGAEFAELKRRQGFEYNGMILHEYYFELLKAGGPGLKSGSGLLKQLGKCFGGFESWKKQFVAMGHMRGTGWVILYHDPRRNSLVNLWIDSHEHGHPAGFAPIVVMDAWEHAYMVDHGAGGRSAYVEAFFQNIDWARAETAFHEAAFGRPMLGPEGSIVERRREIPVPRTNGIERRKTAWK